MNHTSREGKQPNRPFHTAADGSESVHQRTHKDVARVPPLSRPQPFRIPPREPAARTFREATRLPAAPLLEVEEVAYAVKKISGDVANIAQDVPQPGGQIEEATVG